MGKPMKTAHLTWDDVCDRHADNEQITVYYDGIQKSGSRRDEQMKKMFEGCELVKLSRCGYEVMRWPEGKTQCRDWREHKNEDE